MLQTSVDVLWIVLDSSCLVVALTACFYFQYCKRYRNTSDDSSKWLYHTWRAVFMAAAYACSALSTQSCTRAVLVLATFVTNGRLQRVLEKIDVPVMLPIVAVYSALACCLHVVHVRVIVLAGASLVHLSPLLHGAAGVLFGILFSCDCVVMYAQIRKQRFSLTIEDKKTNEENVFTYSHDSASIYSQVTFLWLRKLLSFSYRNHLEFDHLGSLPDRETAAVNFQRFQAIYRKETHCSKNGKVSVLNLWCCYARASCPNFLLGGLLKLLGDAVGLVAPLGIAVIVDYAASIHDPEKSGTELRLTNSTSCPEYSVFEFGNCTSSDSSHRDKDQWRLNQFFSNGYVMALVVLMTSLMQAVFSQTSSHLVCVEGIRLRCALQALMYDKCLRIASWSGTGGTDVVGKAEPRGDSTKDGGGPLASLIGDDVCNVMSCVWIAHYTWAIPLKICIILYLLYINLGISAIVGPTCCIITMTPLQFYIGKNMSANAKRIAERADRRLMKVAEVLQGIKLIKLYGWDSLFEEKITSLRESELKLLNKDSCYWVLITFLTQLSVVVATATSFYLQLEWGEALSAATVFSGLALFNQLAVPLLMLPVLVPVLISAVVSTRRIVDFLNLPEVPHNHISHEVHHHKKLQRRPNVEHNVDENSSPCDDVTYDIEDEADELNADSAQLGDDFCDTPVSVDSDDEADDCGPILVSIRNAVFKWGEDSDDAATLQIDYLDIPKGKFIVVVGASGSGKSSLLAALLGEMNLVKGTVTWSRDGVRSAFAAQRPWLEGGSLRSNVAWQHCGRVWRPRRYMRVLRACALVPDIKLLPDSDSTSLGRGGVLLSGGQRARVSVARALYARAPLLLLDEPLGALDKGTARRVLRAVRTLASSSTRVVATAALVLLPAADYIIAMEDCKVHAAGTLVEIERSHADLASAWRRAAHGSSQGSRSRTGRERWQLLRLVNRIGHQFGDQHGGWTHDDGSPLLHHRASRVSESLEVAMATEWSGWGGRGTKATETRAARAPRLRASKAVSLQPRSGPPTPASRHLSSPPLTTFSDRSSNYPEHAPVSVRPSFIRRLLSITAATRLERTQRTQPAEQKALVVRRVNEPPYAEQQREESLLLTPVHQPKLKSCHSTILDSAQQTQKHSSQTVEGGSEATPAGLTLSNKNTSSDPFTVVSSFEKPWTGAATYVRACGRAACWACVACAVGAQAARTLADYWIDEAATRAHDDTEMWRWLARYMCACSLGAAFAAVCACAAACAGARARRSLHAQLTHRALRLPVRFFDVAPLGDTLNRFSIDIAVIDKKVWAVSLRALQLALVCVCAVVLNVVAAPAALVAFVPAALLYRAVHLAYARLARELQRLDALSHNPIVSQYADTLAGLRTLRAFAQQPRARRMLARSLDVNSHAFLLLNAANRWLGISLDFLGAGILFASTVGALLTARALPGLVPPALLGLVVNATLLVPVYLHWLVKFLAELDAHASAVERVSRYSQLPAHDRQCLCQAGAPVAPNIARADIVLEHVSARYGNSAPMLHDVSLTIPAGQKVAICGRSGSGKSTLLLCCVRGGGVEVFSGSVRVAGTISTCSSCSACSGIALVPQDATLFRGTLRENLDPASAHDDTTLWHSLDVVNLKEFVASQPGGLDCLVSAGGGADGGAWSSARASLVCCARGVLYARTALLLDEPAAALGAREERQLLDALAVHADATGITLVTVAHRVSATLGLQRAVVMAAGRLVEDGVPALLARDSQSRFAAVLRAPLY